MPEQQKATSLYSARAAREVFDVPLEWLVEDADGKLVCTVYDGMTAARIAAALTLAEAAAAGAEVAVLADAIERFKNASELPVVIANG
jgi:hypothetical protein